jgi:hypothetical protein
MHTEFWWEDLRERDHLEEVGVYERIMFKLGLKEVGRGSMDWIDLAQDRGRWRANVNAVLKLRVP